MTPKSKENLIRGEQTTEWKSIYIASILSFVGSTQFSIYFSSLWPYLQLLDSDGDATQSSFGFIIALYSLGQVLSAPVFGYWSNKIKKVKLPLYTGLALMFFGNILYALIERIGEPIYMMMVGRFITGMGSANSALLRTYASTASTVKDRPKAIALVTCGQALGNTAGPAFQLLFTPIGYPGWKVFTKIHLSMYTAPAYFACAMNFFGALSLWLLFKENYAGIIEESPSNDSNSKKIKLPKYDMIAVCVCYLTRFTQMFVNTNLETLGTPIAMMMYNWPQSKAVTNTSIAQGVLGSLTFLTYLIYILTKAERYMHHFRIGCILALFLFLAFHAVTFAYPFWPHVDVQNVSSNSTDRDKNIGCDINLYDWCTNLTEVNIWVYYITYVICIGGAFPSVNITMSTLFSRILGPRRQGTQQGILQMSGSVARMVGPILISFLYIRYGPRIAWIMEGGVIFFTILLWIIFYPRIVPLKFEKHNDEGNQIENGTSEVNREDEDEDLNNRAQTLTRQDLLPDDLKFIFFTAK